MWPFLSVKGIPSLKFIIATVSAEQIKHDTSIYDSGDFELENWQCYVRIVSSFCTLQLGSWRIGTLHNYTAHVAKFYEMERGAGSMYFAYVKYVFICLIIAAIMVFKWADCNLSASARIRSVLCGIRLHVICTYTSWMTLTFLPFINTIISVET